MGAWPGSDLGGLKWVGVLTRMLSPADTLVRVGGCQGREVGPGADEEWVGVAGPGPLLEGAHCFI